MDTETKICSTCGDEKLVDLFSLIHKDGTKRRSRCKKCDSDVWRAYIERKVAADPEFHMKRYGRYYTKENKKRYNLKSIYGITVEEFRAMIEMQKGLCALCGEPLDGTERSDIIDHDHDTGKIRGILHHGCNVALGLLGESADKCRKAAEYLASGGFKYDGMDIHTRVVRNKNVKSSQKV